MTELKMVLNEALAKLSELVNIPIIASGGAGNIQHFVDSFIDGKACSIACISKN
jgi:imidazole glycerol phosphate synthase subunit HisF